MRTPEACDNCPGVANPDQAAQHRVGEAGRALEADPAREQHGLVYDGRVRDRVQAEQLVRAEPEQVSHF